MKKYLIFFCLLVLIGGCAKQNTAELAYRKIAEEANNGNWEYVYDNLDSYSKGQMDTVTNMLLSMSMVFADKQTKQELSNLKGKELFVRLASSEIGTDTKNFVTKPDYEIIKEIQEESTACLIIKDTDGDFQEINMIKENGIWKLKLADLNKIDELEPLKVDEKLTLIEKLQSKIGDVQKTLGATIDDKESQLEHIKQKKIAEEIRKKEELKEKELKSTVQIALVEKSFVPADAMSGRFTAFIQLKLAISNNTPKKIRAIKGTLYFKDVFGDVILPISFKYDKGIPANSKVSWSGGIDYNQFSDEHNKLRSTDIENIVLEWKPTTILFDDGSKLGE